MKKTLLNLSLLFTILYAASTIGVLAFQNTFKPLYLDNSAQGESWIMVFPTVRTAESILCAVLAAAFSLLLRRAGRRLGYGVEIISSVILSCLILSHPAVSFFGDAAETPIWSRQGSWAMANYSITGSLLEFPRFFFILAVFLLLIYAGMSIGYKKRDRSSYSIKRRYL